MKPELGNVHFVLYGGGAGGGVRQDLMCAEKQIETWIALAW